ncbi:hypothetical protein OGR47_09655 [Methylocystis sp. MJC1]|uniref:hypothetical protein n=1 Tax=Methylocystis sp. MJC1 TaxID=2654282 RepID=UPI0013EA4EE3|nr:hypothetical protein [Methylocystis sp. MJC1]KAF2992111.1 hypothetical protein MJC1_00483 [Methylocystis sp. MJC1]MBU6527253.1 hypothetical protein [Methylocystis sp. MJC1]UZX10211.1 hypothetical protein OGR47_09655 [Methylocystis sp. MJC1]
MRNLPWVTLFAILAAAPARATANLDCEIEDKSLKGVISALMGSLPGLLQVHGEFDVLVQGVPDDFRKIILASDNLPHSWVHGKDLKLHAYKEREGERFASFELVVETKMTSDPNRYRGVYELKVSFLLHKGAAESKTVTVRGRASCSLG